MCILEHRDITLDDVIYDLEQRLRVNQRNMERVKRLYHDETTFDELMNKIIEKDRERFQDFIGAVITGKATKYPAPWQLFSTILDIVQNEGEEQLSKCLKIPIPSNKKMLRRNIKYMGWTFHWIHGKGTLLSIYNRSDDLIYQL